VTTPPTVGEHFGGKSRGQDARGADEIVTSGGAGRMVHSTDAAAVWPDHLPVVQVRFARPTNSLEHSVAFYRDCLGLEELYRFENHAGYDGVMLGLPGARYHLELTQHAEIDGTAATKENLLVFFLGSTSSLRPIVERFGAAGHSPVEAENPYWSTVGAVAFEDPDGWQIVLVPQAGL
jgi:catechol 2,3-dioxygenase-like lactoylglutathione lyase family enzyme